MRTLPQATGPLENALRVLLNRQLASSRIPNDLAWVCMNLAAHTGSRPTLESQLEQEARCESEQAAATVDGLIVLGLLDGEAHPTPEGKRELVSTRQRVRALTDQLVDGVSEADLGTTIGVLDHARERAESILSTSTS